MQDSKLSSTQSSQNSTEKTLPPNHVLSEAEGRGELEGGLSQKQRHTKIFATLFFLFALLGFADATYLTLKHYSGSPITCSLTHGCDIVTTSAYSQILGVPVALLGALYYLSVILLSIFVLDRKNTNILRLISRLSWLGLGASVYFIIIQAFILNAWCQYCIGSAITSTSLFVVGMVYLKKQKKN